MPKVSRSNRVTAEVLAEKFLKRFNQMVEADGFAVLNLLDDGACVGAIPECSPLNGRCLFSLMGKYQYETGKETVGQLADAIKEKLDKGSPVHA